MQQNIRNNKMKKIKYESTKKSLRRERDLKLPPLSQNTFYPSSYIILQKINTENYDFILYYFINNIKLITRIPFYINLNGMKSTSGN